jgi:hypothetical protein
MTKWLNCELRVMQDAEGIDRDLFQGKLQNLPAPFESNLDYVAKLLLSLVRKCMESPTDRFDWQIMWFILNTLHSVTYTQQSKSGTNQNSETELTKRDSYADITLYPVPLARDIPHVVLAYGVLLTRVLEMWRKTKWLFDALTGRTRMVTALHLCPL